MDKQKIKKLFDDFLETYDVEEHKLVWEKQSKKFRDFWNNKILDENYSSMIEADLDPIIRILDYLAKGSRKFKNNGGEAVAKLAWISQKKWYKLFRDLKEEKNVREILDSVFKAENKERRINLINKLKEVNKDNISWLTTEKGLVLNNLLFAYNPSQFICMVSLNHRFMVIDYFDFSNKSYSSISYGEKIIQTNDDIIIGFKEKYNIDTVSRALTQFLYFKEIEPLWRISPYG